MQSHKLSPIPQGMSIYFFSVKVGWGKPRWRHTFVIEVITCHTRPTTDSPTTASTKQDGQGQRTEKSAGDLGYRLFIGLYPLHRGSPYPAGNKGTIGQSNSECALCLNPLSSLLSCHSVYRTKATTDSLETASIDDGIHWMGSGKKPRQWWTHGHSDLTRGSKENRPATCWKPFSPYSSTLASLFNTPWINRKKHGYPNLGALRIILYKGS